MFDEFDFSSYLFKFLSVRPQYIRSTMTMRLSIFCKILVFFSHDFHFLFFRIFRERLKCKNKAKWTWKKNFRKKCKIFAKQFFCFAGNPNCDLWINASLFSLLYSISIIKHKISFAKRFFPFRWKPYLKPLDLVK